MQPDDGQMNVSDTLARILEEQLVAATRRLELRLHLFMAAAFLASLVPALFVLYKMQLDRAQGEQGRARRRLQSAGAEGDTEVFEGSCGSSDGLPEHEPSAPSAPSRARRRNLPTRTASESDLNARSGTRLLPRPSQASATSGPLHSSEGA